MAGVQKFGKNFLAKFTELSVTKKVPLAYVTDAQIYYQSCRQEIDHYSGKHYPKKLFHDPPAQAINKVVEQAYAKNRFDLIRIIQDDYYAPFKWPAITLLATGGYTNSVRIMLNLCPDSINSKDFLLRTPLICAARNDKLEIVRLLIEHDADIDFKDACNCDAWCHAVRRRHEKIADLLQAKDKELRRKNKQQGKVNVR